MSKKTSIDTVSLTAHATHMMLWVHRGDKCNYYLATQHSAHKKTPLRILRFKFIHTAFMNVAELEITSKRSE